MNVYIHTCTSCSSMVASWKPNLNLLSENRLHVTNRYKISKGILTLNPQNARRNPRSACDHEIEDGVVTFGLVTFGGVTFGVVILVWWPLYRRWVWIVPKAVSAIPTWACRNSEEQKWQRVSRYSGPNPLVWITSSESGSPPLSLNHLLWVWITSSEYGSPPLSMDHLLWVWITSSEYGSPPLSLDHLLRIWITSSESGSPALCLDHLLWAWITSSESERYRLKPNYHNIRFSWGLWFISVIPVSVHELCSTIARGGTTIFVHSQSYMHHHAIIHHSRAIAHHPNAIIHASSHNHTSPSHNHTCIITQS